MNSCILQLKIGLWRTCFHPSYKFSHCVDLVHKLHILFFYGLDKWCKCSTVIWLAFLWVFFCQFSLIYPLRSQQFCQVVQRDLRHNQWVCFQNTETGGSVSLQHMSGLPLCIQTPDDVSGAWQMLNDVGTRTHTGQSVTVCSHFIFKKKMLSIQAKCFDTFSSEKILPLECSEKSQHFVTVWSSLSLSKGFWVQVSKRAEKSESDGYTSELPLPTVNNWCLSLQNSNTKMCWHN